MKYKEIKMVVQTVLKVSAMNTEYHPEFLSNLYKNLEMQSIEIASTSRCTAKYIARPHLFVVSLG